MATLNATVKVNGGHCILYLIEQDNNTTIRTIQDNGTATCDLVPGVQYRIEWHFWSSTAATYALSITSAIGKPHFPFNNTYSYPGPHNDMGAFNFSA